MVSKDKGHWNCLAARLRTDLRMAYVSCLFLLMFSVVPTANALQYHLTDLGTLPGYTSSNAIGINNNGLVVGNCNGSGVSDHAFVYDGSTMTDLGMLPGGSWAESHAINDSGQIVGGVQELGGMVAFRYSGATMTNIGPPLSVASCAYGINRSGQIVGSEGIPGSNTHAYLQTGTTITDLGAASIAYSINSSGMVVGFASTNGNRHAFLYDGTTMVDLGALGRIYSEARCINDRAEIVGLTGPNMYPSDQRAFLYSNSTMIDLGTLPGDSASAAWGINNSGQVVGASGPNSAFGHAFLYSGVTMTDLNVLLDSSRIGWTVTAANAINDKGQIVGMGTSPSGYTHAVLLTPISDFATWVSGTGGNWSTPGSWSPHVPNSSDATVTFGSAITAHQRVTLDAVQTAGTLNFDNVNGYAVDGPGTLTLQVSGGRAIVNVFNGSHSISAPLLLRSNLDILVSGVADTLTINSSIGETAAGTELAKFGAGTLVLGGADGHSGKTTVRGGTLVLNNPQALQNSTLDYNNYGGSVSFGILTAATFGGLQGSQALATTNANSQPVALTVGGNNAATTYAGILSGTGSLIKTGNNALTLTGANTHSGGTTLAAGRLNINNAKALGDSAGTFTIAGDGTSAIDNTWGPITLLNNNPQAWNADFTFAGPRDLNLGSGAVTLGGNRTVTVTAGTLTVGGVIGGNYSLTKAGSGTLTLSGANTYTGDTTLSAGWMNINNATALGTSSGMLIISGTSTLGNTSGTTVTLATNNPQRWDADFTFAGTGALNLGSGPVTLGGNRQVTISAGMLTVGGAIGGNYSLTKAGSGTLTLSGANTYIGGTTLAAGQLNINNPWALPTGTFTIAGASTLDNTAPTTVALANNNPQVWNGNFTFAGTRNLDLGSGAVTLGGNRVVTVSTKTLSVGGPIDGNYSLTKSGWGALTLSGPNTYTGGTTLSAGQLNINNPTALGAAVGKFTISEMTSIDNTTAGPITLTNNNPQVWSGNFTFAGTQDLDLGSGAVTLIGNRKVTVIARTLTVGGVIGGDYSLTKTGSGTLSLGGTNTFTGITTVSEGKLQVNGSLANNGSDKVLVAKDADGLLGSSSGDASITRRVAASGTYAGLGSTITNLAAGELLTKADILAGSASAQADVGMAWRTRTAVEKTQAGGGLIGEILDLSGITHTGLGVDQTDTFVLQMNYDEGELTRIWGMTESQAVAQGRLYLGSLDLSDNAWHRAVDGNFGGTAHFVGNHPYDASYFVLGNYGVDITDNVVWAVVNHNSQFAAVPEPSTFVLLGVGAIGLLGYIRRRRRAM